MTKVLIYGASDDLVEVEGDIRGADEFNVYGPWEGRLVGPDDESLIVRAEYGKRGAESEWLLSVENTASYPAWPIAFGQRPDREGDPAITIDVPAGTRLVVAAG